MALTWAGVITILFLRRSLPPGRIKSIIPKILCGLFELSIIEQLYTDAVRCRSQLLPGRSFPRKKLKSKGRSHFRNKKASF